jgi:hypothetical protein
MHEEPVLITAHDDGECFLHDHLTHFFDTVSYNIINCLSQEDKERYFKLVTDHEALITKLYEDSVLNSVIFLPVSLRKRVNDKLVHEYLAWLERK